MKKQFVHAILLLASSILFFSSCQKVIENKPVTREEIATAASNTQGHLKQTKTFSSEIVQKWLGLKLRILLTAQEQNTTSGFLVARFYAALGISLYESVVPGMPAYQSLSDQLQDMPDMPEALPGLAYHWPASANAALASTFRKFLPNATAANKASIDSLENALNQSYITQVNTETFLRSKTFGAEVANRIFNWSATDGFFAVNPPYIPPVGAGLWVPTPPGFAAPSGPYWGNLRTLMPGVLNQTSPPLPIPYSASASSSFFNSMQEVYNTRQMLANDPVLKAKAQYWRGTPGGSGFIVWYAIFRKILSEQQNNVMLDKAALVYCKLGIVQREGAVAVIRAKYLYNELAPITYIRTIMGQVTWNSEFPTPALPCYPELHAPQNSSSAAVLSHAFGSNYQINTNGVHPLGLPGYIFNSFEEAAEHANQSRFLGGVSTQHAVNAGAWIGNRTVEYMNDQILFLK